MKLIDYFKEFLKKEVNLNPNRIELLDQRVEAITNFLSADETLKNNYLDIIPQGSYAHKTIIKPVQVYHEFDADLLLYLEEFEEWEAEDYVQKLYEIFRGDSTYRDMVKRKTRCIVVNYKGDFHIDVVPYLERHGKKYVTNRHENTFELTNPEAYNTWLDEKNRTANNHLIKVIRLIKYLRNYKTTFSVKSIILNVLLGERVNDAALLEDPSCYQDVPTTLRTVMNKLKDYLQNNIYMPMIMDPSETGEDFSNRWDQDGYANFRKWITYYADKIEDAYSEPNKEKSLEKWQLVFGDCFKAPDTSSNKRSGTVAASDTSINYTEQQLSDLGFTEIIDPRYKLRVQGEVIAKAGFRSYLLNAKGNNVSPNRYIQFSINICTVPKPYKIYWKVLNRGEEALRHNSIRGEIIEGGSVWRRNESTNFRGNHYVECYIIKDNVCVAKNRQQVNIT